MIKKEFLSIFKSALKFKAILTESGTQTWVLLPRPIIVLLVHEKKQLK